MGDTMEITTYPKQYNMFYRVSSNALMFEVKASGNVCVGLGSRPLPPCEVWVINMYNVKDTNVQWPKYEAKCGNYGCVAIGCGRHTWIGKSYEDLIECETPSILSKDEFRSFLITWINNCVSISRTGDTKPIISNKTMNTSAIMYVTFSIAENGREPAYWKFEVPPLLQPQITVRLNSRKPEWVRAEKNKVIPDDALIGGYEEEPLYIMRAPHNGSLASGKLVSSTGLGYIAWDHSSHEKTDFEVLCGSNCIWVKSFKDRVPAGAVVAGHSEYLQGIIYVGRAEHEGHIIPGKVQPTHKVCFIAYKGVEIPKEHFEVLVVPDDSLQTVNNNINFASQVINIPPCIAQVPHNYYYEAYDD